jgi:predicted DNA-binding transcriptional regulator AlpA
MARKLVIPERLPEYGIDLTSRQRKRLEDLGLFPRRVPISERSHAYVEEELLALTEAKIAARDEQAA